MGMTGISKSQVSRLCGDIDERVGAFLNRPLEGDWPYLWIDATYVKVRQAGRIVSVAVIIAVGVTTDGIREVLGVAVGPSEAEPFWTDFLRSLTRRGLGGVKLVISDSHSGLKAAIAKISRQRGGVAACISCVTRWLTPARANGKWCSRSSTPRSRKRRPKPKAHNGTSSRISSPRSFRSSRSCSAMPSTTCWRSWASESASHPDRIDEPTRASQRRDQAAYRRRRHLPQRRGDRPAHRRALTRAERRVAITASLYAVRRTPSRER